MISSLCGDCGIRATMRHLRKTFVEMEPFPLLPDAVRASLTDAVAKTLGLGNVGAQAAQGVSDARGIIRLAPETLKQMQAGAKPLTSGGQNLGTLVGKDGRIVSQVRWLPAGGQGAVAVLAALGPAAALVAVPFQLAQISSLVRENIELTGELLRTLRAEQWATLTGLQETTAKALDEARHVGAVTDHIWQNVSGREADLRAQRDLFRRHTASHLRDLRSKRAHKDRRQFLEKHGEAILLDAQSLLMAQSAWFVYQAVRAGHIQGDAATDERAAKLLDKVVRDAREEHERSLAHADGLLKSLIRECRILSELPGKRTLPFTSGRRAAKDVSRMAEALQEGIATARMRAVHAPPAPLSPQIMVFESDPPPEPLRILRWQLEEGETLLALADALLDRRWDNDGFLAVTDRRVLVMNQHDLKRHGTVEQTFDRADFRFVRLFEGSGDKSPVIDVITRDENLRYFFGRDEPAPSSSGRLSDLLANTMHIPEDEVPLDPLTAGEVTPEIEAPRED